jgi:cell fate regulator YaaT (PSP1 superfamily)
MNIEIPDNEDNEPLDDPARGTRYVARYGVMRMLGVFGSKIQEPLSRGTSVIARTNRGLEIAQVLCLATDDALSYLDNPANGQILRVIEEEDANEIAHIEGSKAEKLKSCQKYVDRLDLDMQLVEIEQLFGGERIIIYYLAEQRVDFRQLVKDLAAEFQTRIEMRQIGVRDEAKLLADYGDCGKPVCCNTHLTAMPPVSMKMAKIQKATLDPTKISGRCGRLKCCLRYEYDTYEELQNQLPAIGARVVTEIGTGKVLHQELLVQQLLVEMEDHRRVLIDASEVLSVINEQAAQPR